jgi:hypothetical protein
MFRPRAESALIDALDAYSTANECSARRGTVGGLAYGAEHELQAAVRAPSPSAGGGADLSSLWRAGNRGGPHHVARVDSGEHARSRGFPSGGIGPQGNLQALCHRCHADKTEQEFPDARERFGKLWAARKTRVPTRIEPMDTCVLCGGPLYFNETICDAHCERCDPGIDAGGDIQDSYHGSRLAD